MKVMLKIRGEQRYPDQEPEVIELVTEGTMEQTEQGWNLSYAESALTGMEGVVTTFCVAPGVVTLKRSGKLTSEMVFREGVPHESLYASEFGAMMIAVCANAVRWDLTPQGGTVDVTYTIEIEQSIAGMVHYHLDVKRMPEE